MNALNQGCKVAMLAGIFMSAAPTTRVTRRGRTTIEPCIISSSLFCERTSEENRYMFVFKVLLIFYKISGNLGATTDRPL